MKATTTLLPATRTTDRDGAVSQQLIGMDEPIGFEAGDANVRRYVGNSPTTATDPSGLQEAQAPKVGKISASNLPELMQHDPVLRTLSDAQRRDLINKLQDPDSIEFKFAASLVLNASKITKDEYQKTWWLLGPGDRNFPGNEDEYKTTYNCLGHVLMWYGKKTYDGKDILSNGRATWPAIPEIFGADQLDRYLQKFDQIFNSLGPGFTRMAWKPDLSSLKAAANPKLPTFQNGKNYIVILGSLYNRGGDDKPVEAIYLKHTFTNFDRDNKWWISKGANGGTFLHGVDGLTGDDEIRTGYGFILAIYEQKSK